MSDYKLKRDDRPPLGMWAPGEYLKTCLDCEQHFIGDKRAAQCADCAYKPIPDATDSHPAFKRTFWINLYPDGDMTSTLCPTKEQALHRCTYTGEIPDAIQVEVKIVPKSR